MKKKKSFKQIIAIVGIALLLGLYLSTLVFALIKSPWSQTMLKISLLGTIGIPIILYLIIMFCKLAKGKSKTEEKVYADESNDPYTEEDFKDK